MNEKKYREASQVAFDYVVETDQHNLTESFTGFIYTIMRTFHRNICYQLR
jgi:hypothetical protein